jgi:hypothetical protein
MGHTFTVWTRTQHGMGRGWCSHIKKSDFTTTERVSDRRHSFSQYNKCCLMYLYTWDCKYKTVNWSAKCHSNSSAFETLCFPVLPISVTPRYCTQQQLTVILSLLEHLLTPHPAEWHNSYEWWAGKNVKAGSRGLFCGTIMQYARINWRKQLKFWRAILQVTIRILGLSNTKSLLFVRVWNLASTDILGMFKNKHLRTSDSEMDKEYGELIT